MLKSRLRLVIALVMLAISLAALAWSILPGARIVRRQRIQPTEMQFPTPASFLPPEKALAGLELSYEAIRSSLGGVERFEPLA
jgi:hypothetical protein